jgi:hypothetical protein
MPFLGGAAATGAAHPQSKATAPNSQEAPGSTRRMPRAMTVSAFAPGSRDSRQRASTSLEQGMVNASAPSSQHSWQRAAHP